MIVYIVISASEIISARDNCRDIVVVLDIISARDNDMKGHRDR